MWMELTVNREVGAVTNNNIFRLIVFAFAQCSP